MHWLNACYVSLWRGVLLGNDHCICRSTKGQILKRGQLKDFEFLKLRFKLFKAGKRGFFPWKTVFPYLKTWPKIFYPLWTTVTVLKLDHTVIYSDRISKCNQHCLCVSKNSKQLLFTLCKDHESLWTTVQFENLTVKQFINYSDRISKCKQYCLCVCKNSEQLLSTLI